MKPLSITAKRMLRSAVAAFCACACVFAVSACGADETGKMVAEIFGGADVSTMPVVKMSDMTVYVNTKTADAIGVEIPQSVMDKATVLE